LKRGLSGGGREEFLRRLDMISCELARHVRTDREGACLEEAACRCPSLGPRLRELQKQNTQLLSSIDQFAAKLSHMPQLPQAEVAGEFSSLASALRLQEAAENRILADAFGVDWSADDCQETRAAT
jgi:hypothetical protein